MEDIRYIKLRRATAAEWASINPVLREGEPAWETDAKKLKVGDGVTPYSSLPYSATDLSAVATAIANAETATTNATNAAGSATSAASSANTAAAGANASKSACDATNASVTSAESARVSAESARVSAESSRVSAESARVSAESTRASNEETRIENETARQSAESTRSSLFNSAQGQRAADFNTAQDQRAASFATEQSNRATAFATEQTNRGNTFTGSEASRATTFSTNEGASTDAANANGSRWARFNASEASRAATFTGKESQRDAAVSTATALTPRVEALEDDKVSFGDYDPSLRAGVADTAYDVIADNTETETFTSRVVGNTSGGHAITKGNASVKVMKGNSVVWNQQAKEFNATNYKAGRNYSSYISVDADGNLVCTSNNGTEVYLANNNAIANHKYLVRFQVKSNDGTSIYSLVGGTLSPLNSTTTSFSEISNVLTASSASYICLLYSSISGKVFTIKKDSVEVVDITKMFNGNTAIINAITNYETFIKYAPIVQNTYEYNEGTLISNNATSIRSKDTNGVVFATRPTLIKSIKDAQGNVVFPNGLLKAGSVADSIDYRAGKAVKRVGSVKLKELSWDSYSGIAFQTFIANRKIGENLGYICNRYNNGAGLVSEMENKTLKPGGYSSSTDFYVKDSSYTDAEHFAASLTESDLLFYELATPIEYTFDTSHLDYPIVNGGVEELVAEGNVAPIVADITYPCSANGTIDAILERVGMVEDANGVIVSLSPTIQAYQILFANMWNISADKVGVADFGGLNWLYNTSNAYFSASEPFLYKLSSSTKSICIKYPFQGMLGGISAVQEGKYMLYYSSNTGARYISVKDSNYTSVKSLKDATKGIYVFYEKA